MELFGSIETLGHEQVLFCQDRDAGYRAIIAIHSTRLGPAVGGTRLWRYPTEEAALVDALRLSRGMTYKNAAAGLELGGGKSIILLGDEPPDREKLFRAHGRFVDRLGGRYITAEDVGTSPADMAIIREETRYVGGLPGGVGDPSPWTARGVFRGIQAASRQRWGSDDLAGRRVAIQGCGNVGRHLARELARAGVSLVVADVDAGRAAAVAAEVGAHVAAPDEIYDADVDVFAPCALGGTLNDETVARLRAAIVAGAANNQLLEERHGDALEARGILYAPDYVVNAGGVLSGGVVLLGWDASAIPPRVEAIYDTLGEVFALAAGEGIPTWRAADRLAERSLGVT